MSILVKTSYEHFRLRAGLSIVEVAARTGISVRDIAAAERGQYLHAPRELHALCEVYGVSLPKLLNTEIEQKTTSHTALIRVLSVVILSMVIVFFAQAPISDYIASAASIAHASAANLPLGVSASALRPPDLNGASDHIRHQLLVLAIAGPAVSNSAMGGQTDIKSSDSSNTTPLAAIASKRGALGAPYGCPVQPVQGQVVMTQGYNVGTHAPAAAWGAVDLAVDGDGNGYADPSATVGAPVVALHAGIAKVVPNNWLAGNYVRLTDELNGWATAYAHLKKLNITNGQRIEPGMIIGWVGTTGYSSGPHLHYEIYHHDININPLTVLECW
jgi:murein DD-endopeptidase MepM/ murein hydrolase activator NlpD